MDVAFIKELFDLSVVACQREVTYADVDVLIGQNLVLLRRHGFFVVIFLVVSLVVVIAAVASSPASAVITIPAITLTTSATTTTCIIVSAADVLVIVCVLVSAWWGGVPGRPPRRAVLRGRGAGRGSILSRVLCRPPAWTRRSLSLLSLGGHPLLPSIPVWTVTMM